VCIPETAKNFVFANTKRGYQTIRKQCESLFELRLKKRMHGFLSQMMADLKEFTIEQEKARDQFNRDLMDSWRSQKERSNGRSKRRRRDKR